MIKKIINWFKGYSSEMSFQQSFDLTDLPVITFWQGNSKFNLLLDTGSSDNIIEESIVSSVEHSMYDGNGELTGLDGIVHKVSACDITFTYKNQEYTYMYLIKDMKDAFAYIKKETGVTLHGIIGTKFFAKYKYVLDFDTLTAYSKQ